MKEASTRGERRVRFIEWVRCRKKRGCIRAGDSNFQGALRKMLEIDWIRERVYGNQYLYSRHGDRERQNDSLSLQEVETALLAGRILEQYEDTGRGESCLVVGFTEVGKPVHIVCGRLGEQMVVITIYVPKPPKFKMPYERGE